MARALAFEKHGWSGKEENGKVDAVSGGCVTAYSWEDTDDRVKIRFPTDLRETPASLDWTAWSVRLAFGANGGEVFEIKSLAAPITLAEMTRSRRDGAPILALVKETQTPWMRLTGLASGKKQRGIAREDSESALSDSQLEEAFGEDFDFAGVGADEDDEGNWENDAEFNGEQEDTRTRGSASQAMDPEDECDGSVADNVPRGNRNTWLDRHCS